METPDKKLVSIIMGSDSDLPVMQAAAQILDHLGIKYDLTVVSAHRTPDRMNDYVKKAEEMGIEVIIAGAGGAAHLPGMNASHTHLPVVGVPIRGSNLNGLDSLLSIVQMPRGIPVATMGINNAKNAGIYAAQILGVKYPEIKQKVIDYKQEIKQEVLEKAAKLEEIGYKDYLDSQK